MQFLAVSTNTKDVAPYLADEFARIEELRATGVIVAGWVKADFSGGVLVVEGEDVDAVTTSLNSLPIAENGATEFELTPVVDLDTVRAAL